MLALYIFMGLIIVFGIMYVKNSYPDIDIVIIIVLLLMLGICLLIWRANT